MPYYTVRISVQYTTEKGIQKQSSWDADLVTGTNSPFEFQCNKSATPILYRAEFFDFTIKRYGRMYRMIPIDLLPEDELDIELHELPQKTKKNAQYHWRKERTDSRIASKAENHKARFTQSIGEIIEITYELLLRDSLPFPFDDFLDAQFVYEIFQQAQYINFIVQIDGKTYRLETINPADDVPTTSPY